MMIHPAAACFVALVVGIGYAMYQYYSTNNYAETYQHTYQSNRTRSPESHNITTMCSICHDLVSSENYDSIAFEDCKHLFHAKCLRTWHKEELQAHRCPNCYSAILSPD